MLTLMLFGREIFNGPDFFGLSNGAMLPPELAHFFLHLEKFEALKGLDLCLPSLQALRSKVFARAYETLSHLSLISNP
jgi:hypothetical protein